MLEGVLDPVLPTVLHPVLYGVLGKVALTQSLLIVRLYQFALISYGLTLITAHVGF